MKLVKILLKAICRILLLVVIFYVFVFTAFLISRDSVSEKNISAVVKEIDLIKDGSSFFNLEERTIERRINDTKLGNITYERKKELIYNSSLYAIIQDYITDSLVYFVGYIKEQPIITEETKVNSKKALISEIKKIDNTVTEEELLILNNSIDELYINLEKFETESIMDILPNQYKQYPDYIKGNAIMTFGIIILLGLLALIGLLSFSYTTPLKYLSFSTFIVAFLYKGIGTINSVRITDSVLTAKIKEIVNHSIDNHMTILVAISIVCLVLGKYLPIVIKRNFKEKEEEKRIDIEKIDTTNTKI